MDNKGINYGLLFGLGFVAMVISSVFATLYNNAEATPARTVYKLLAGLPSLSLSIVLLLKFSKKDASGNYRETSFWRWISIIVVIVCVSAILFMFLYTN